MSKRLLIAFCTLMAMPAIAQYSAPAAFTQQKTKIDSLARVVDDMFPIERAVFNGRTKAGRYRVECYYNKDSKEILKANFLVITDSINYNKVYWFKGNSVIKVNYNNSAMYYQLGSQLYSNDGDVVNTASLKKLMDLVTDTWQGLYAGIFQ